MARYAKYDIILVTGST